MTLKNKDRMILYSLAVAVMVLAAWNITEFFKRDKVAYINIGRLINQYKFKADLENTASGNLSAIKNAVDSLDLIKRSFNGMPSPVDSQLNYAQYALKEYYMLSNQEINKAIWERLNPLIDEYGKSRHIELLIGANGTGTVLYGSPKKDLTDDLIVYINSKYEKGN